MLVSQFYKMRKWLILASYFAVSSLNGAAWLTISPIPEEAKSYYDINDAELTLYSYSFFFSSVILSVPSSMLVSYSVKWALHEMWLTTFLGCWIRVLAGRNFWISFVGQLIISCGNMPMLVACSSLATEWFPSSHHILATTIAASANFVGMGASYIVITQFPDIESVLWYESYIASGCLLLHFLIAANSPFPTEKKDLKNDLVLALKDNIHMTFILLISSGLGTIYSIISIIGLLLEEQGYSIKDIGWMGFIFSMAGLLGGLLAAYLAEVKKSTRVSLAVFLLLAIISAFGFSAVIQIEIADFVVAIIYGGTIISTLPLGIRACVEYMNEIHDSIPTNMIYMISQILSCIYTYPIQFSKDIIGISGLWVAAGIVLLSYLPLFFMTRKFEGDNFSKENYKGARIKIDQSINLLNNDH